MAEKERLLTDEEAEHLLDLKQAAMTLKGAEFRKFRRDIRYRLFRIREGRLEYDNGLKKLIEQQFEPDMKWDNFTFRWDVSPKDPLKVIMEAEWVSEGGAFEQVMVQGEDGVVRPQRVYTPPAFTRQG